MADLPNLHARLRTVSVTGTNGKTTTTSMIDAIVAASGEPSARVTTLGGYVNGERITEDKSWAAFVVLVERAVAAGVRTFAMETTSRALAGGMATKWPPHVAVFTNLTRDHLDRHGTLEEYLAAKARLFLALPPGGVAVLNAADPVCALIAEVMPEHAEVRAYAAEPRAPENASLPVALEARSVHATRDGTRVALEPSPLADRLGGALALRVVGAVHAANALGAAIAADAAGYAPEAIRAGLERFEGVPGRFQVIASRPLVAVDYAHTPDALERTLRTARALVAADGGRVICVFGCGGDRDTGKRPEMGRIADGGCDVVYLTNDNPRSEDPARIADEVAAGASGRAQWTRELDRARAIERAIADAAPVDAVVIAGKGHEETQEIAGALLPFSDAKVARRTLGARA